MDPFSSEPTVPRPKAKGRGEMLKRKTQSSTPAQVSAAAPQVVPQSVPKSVIEEPTNPMGITAKPVVTGRGRGGRGRGLR